MLEHLGDVFEGIIASVTSRGLFVEIPEFALDGFVPIDSLKGVYEYDERRMCLRKRPGHTILAVGDPMKIKVVNVSVEDAQIEFAQEES